jgi:hypothetical protein
MTQKHIEKSLDDSCLASSAFECAVSDGVFTTLTEELDLMCADNSGG